MFATRSPALNPVLQDAVEVAAEVLLQAPVLIAPRIGLRIATRIGGKVGLAVAARIRPRVTIRKGPVVALQIGRRTDGENHPQTPDRALLETTPGTVPRTVPTVVRGAPFSACF